MKSSQSAVLPGSSLTRQTGRGAQPNAVGQCTPSTPPTHSHPAMTSSNSLSRQQVQTAAGPGAVSSGKKSSSFNVLNKAAPLFKASMPSLVAGAGPASPATPRPPLTSDIDALLSIEANTSSTGDGAASPAVGQAGPAMSPSAQARPRGVSQLVAAKFKQATSPGHSTSQVSPFQRSVSTKSAKQAAALAAPATGPTDDPYVPEPHLPHLRHGRKNMDIDSIMAEVEERARAGSAPASPPSDGVDHGTKNPDHLSPLRDRSGSKRSFRRWSMPGLTNQTRDPGVDAAPSDTASSKGTRTRQASSRLTARIGQLASSITSPLRRRHRSMQELSTPRMQAMAPMLTAAEGASVRDLPLPTPMDIDELLTRFGTSDSHLVRGSGVRAAKKKPGATADSVVIVRPGRHMSTSSGPPIRVPGDDTSSIRPLRRPSHLTDTSEADSAHALVNSNEAVHRAGHLLASSGASTPTSLSAFSSNDRMSVQAMHTSTVPRASDASEGHHGPTAGVSVAPNVATIAETSQGALPGALGVVGGARRTSAAESTGRISDVSSIVSMDVDSSNARALEALRAMPRPVLDKVYVHHCNDFDAVVTPAEEQQCL